MKVYYWIIKLRLFRLLGLLRRQKYQDIAAVSYLESTKPANAVLKLLKKIGLLTLPLHKIKSRTTASGPHLNFSSVKNDKNEVITLDVLHHIIRIRGQIWQNMEKSFKDFAFLKDKISANMKAAYFALKIAEEITPIVYIANYARWQNYEKDGEKRKNILVIPGFDWSATLAEELGHQVEEVVIGKKEIKQKIKRLALILRHVIISIVKLGLKVIFSKPREIVSMGKNGKLMAIYAMGIFSDRRNDLSYFHAAHMNPERLTLFLRYKALRPSPEEMKWLEENGVACYATPGMEPPIPGVPEWESSPNLKNRLNDFYRLYLKTFFQCLSRGKRHFLWLMDKYWEMGRKSSLWEDFFLANKINIIVHQIPTAENFILSYAISEVGGISLSLERSMLWDCCTYLHNPPNHLYLITGPYSLTQIPEPSFSLCTVQVGSLHVTNNHIDIPGLDELKRQFNIILSIFDEMPSDWFFGGSIKQLYQAIIDLVKQDERFGILIKSKKPQVFQTLKDVDKEIQKLSAWGKCLVLNWKVPVSEAALSSDLAVCIPSTAAFESFLTGTRTVIFNPMRCGSRVFYKNNGLGRRVFENSKTLVEALENYANGEDNSIGDCSDLLSFIDPFNDKRGSERIGNYLNWCLDGFDAGLDRGQTIAAANERYMQKWGKDKITNENAYFKNL